MSHTVTVAYALCPPLSTITPAGLQLNATHELPVKADLQAAQLRSEEYKAYYAALRNAVEEAKELLGAELTAWRDAVGDGEMHKAKGKISQDEDEDIGEREDDEDEDEEIE